MKLTVPLQHTRADPSVDTRSPALRGWVADLRYVQTLDTAREIGRRLDALNRQPLPPPQRLELLEIMGTAWQRLQEPLATLRPGNPAAHTALAALRDMAREMAYGYKAAVLDALREGAPRGHRRVLPHALAGAAQYLGHLVVATYQDYGRDPGPVWAELGTLLDHADYHGCLDADAKAGPCGSVAAIYGHLALLRLADPYRLPPGLIWQAARYLGRREGVSLSRDAPATGVGVFPLQAGQVPVPGIEPPPDTPLWWLDARPLLRDTQRQMDRLLTGLRVTELGFTDNLPASDAIYLLGRLLAAWGQPGRRRQERAPDQGAVDLAAGLEAACYILNGSQPYDPQSYADPTQDDNIDLGVQAARLAAHRDQRYTTLCARSRNRSSGGQALEVATLEARNLQVGQLVTLQGGASPSWLVAVVRWLRHGQGNGDGTLLGVQYVARGARPVALRPLWRGTVREFQAGLWTRLMAREGELLTLIAPKGLYRQGELVELGRDGGLQVVRCGRLLEQAPGFDRFVYHALEA